MKQIFRLQERKKFLQRRQDLLSNIQRDRVLAYLPTIPAFNTELAANSAELALIGRVLKTN